MNYIISALNLQQVAKLSVRPWAVGSSLSEPVAQRDRGNHNWEDKCGYITKCTTLHKKYMHVCTCMYMYCCGWCVAAVAPYMQNASLF